MGLYLGFRVSGPSSCLGFIGVRGRAGCSAIRHTSPMRNFKRKPRLVREICSRRCYDFYN